MDEEMIEEEKDQFCELAPPTLGSRVSEFEELNLKYSYSGISNASSSNDFMLTTTRSFTEDFMAKLNFVESASLFQTINKWATDLEKRMMIHSELIIYLLYLFKWNEEKLNDVYYDQLVGEFNVLNEALLKKAFWQNYLEDNQNKETNKVMGCCDICCEENLTLYCNTFCQHYYCKSCWADFIQENLKTNRIFFPCMHIECQKCPILPEFVAEVAPELLELYKKKICINYSIVNKSISYCPSDHCEFFCEKPSILEQNYVECPCGRTYCFKCEKEPHEPASCFEVEKWTKLTNEEKNNDVWIEKYTRKCPTCKQSVEKYVGCNHVKCVCGTEFCFACNSVWDEKHKSSSECQVIKQKIFTQKENQHSIEPLMDKLIYISQEINHDMTIIKHTLELLAKEESLHYLKDLFQDIKTKVHHAWTNIKWSIVALFLREKPSIEVEIEKDSIESIQNLMETVSKIEKKISNYDHFSFSHFLFAESKDLPHLKEELFKRKETMNKTMEVWTEAWRNNAGEY